LFIFSQTVVAKVFSAAVLTTSNFGMASETRLSLTVLVTAHADFFLCVRVDHFLQPSDPNHLGFAPVCISAKTCLLSTAWLLRLLNYDATAPPDLQVLANR